MPYVNTDDSRRLSEAIRCLRGAITDLECAREMLRLHPSFIENDVQKIEQETRTLLENVIGEKE